MELDLHQYNEYINSLNRLGLIDENNYYTKINDRYWDFSGASYEQLEPLISIYKEGMSLIDLGCGAGNVMFFSKQIGYKVTGIDYKYKYKKFCILYGEFILKNLEELDLSILKNYDVIYSYRPLRIGFEDFLDKLIDNMYSGQYLLIPDMCLIDNRLERIEGYLYRFKLVYP